MADRGYVCPACGRSAFVCLCAETCAICGIFTNHDTQAHEAAMAEHEATEDTT